jgi:type VI secretion system protein VasG
MFGGEKNVVTINMSEFQESHTTSRLIGSPPGYVGYGEGGMLTEAVRQNPYSVSSWTRWKGPPGCHEPVLSGL